MTRTEVATLLLSDALPLTRTRAQWEGAWAEVLKYLRLNAKLVLLKDDLRHAAEGTSVDMNSALKLLEEVTALPVPRTVDAVEAVLKTFEK